jgi:hypothetical protein
MAKKPAAKQPAMEQPAGNVVRNLTDQALAIGGVTIVPGGEAAIDNWDAVKDTAVIVLWLSHGVIEVANGAS